MQLVSHEQESLLCIWFCCCYRLFERATQAFGPIQEAQRQGILYFYVLYFVFCISMYCICILYFYVLYFVFLYIFDLIVAVIWALAVFSFSWLMEVFQSSSFSTNWIWLGTGYFNKPGQSKISQIKSVSNQIISSIIKNQMKTVSSDVTNCNPFWRPCCPVQNNTVQALQRQGGSFANSQIKSNKLNPFHPDCKTIFSRILKIFFLPFQFLISVIAIPKRFTSYSS